MSMLSEKIEEICLRYADKTAVACEETHITFSQLFHGACQMAQTIRNFGMGQPIGVFANRSITPALWYLAVLFSGNFYVPLDPDLPVGKLEAIIQDAQLSCILGEEENREKLLQLSYSGAFVTNADVSDSECPPVPVTESAPAYMVYTSGSTGKPKGVLKSHGAVSSYIAAFLRQFPFDDSEVIGNQTPFFFDASAKDYYLMLATGAKLEIIPTARFFMPTELMEYLNEKKITFASWVPTAISIVAQLNPFSMVKPQYLKRLFFVGEVMPMKHLNKWRQALPEIQYVNLYGQSELAGVCCYYEVTGEFADSDVLPMGRCLDNCRIYLTDGEQIVTQPGVVGEMYLVSPALAVEYYHDAQKTADSFLMRDFGNGPERCLKTGDLAQLDEQGNLLFVARVDYQIKHMGHRIELGEIEAVAGALPEVGRCCCLYDAPKKKIVLFCEPAVGSTPTATALRSALRSLLVSYMVPGKVIVVDKLPLNANGKIDRQKLTKMME